MKKNFKRLRRIRKLLPSANVGWITTASKPVLAYADVLEILTREPGVRAHAHFFAGSWDIAERYLARGITLSFTGVITFARGYDEVIRKTPQNMLLTETDAPFVAPEPYRGKRNEPCYGREELAAALLHNARRVLALPAGRFAIDK